MVTAATTVLKFAAEESQRQTKTVCIFPIQSSLAFWRLARCKSLPRFLLNRTTENFTQLHGETAASEVTVTQQLAKLDRQKDLALQCSSFILVCMYLMDKASHHYKLHRGQHHHSKIKELRFHFLPQSRSKSTFFFPHKNCLFSQSLTRNIC